MATLPIVQSIPLVSWFKLVNDSLTEPYLDEVFHVRQAQHYCRGHFTVWDPKITTPPGLYLLSFAISPLLGCNLFALRSVGFLCLNTLLAVVCWTYFTRRRSSQHGIATQHSALNVAFFPPLFFFSALYYTDVASTLSVLSFYCFFLYSDRNHLSQWLRGPVLVLLGSVSLMFRQTNIFWVAVFPAGLVLMSELDRGHRVVKESMEHGAEGFGDSWMSVAKTTWKMQVVFDPPVTEAWLEDYVKTVISICLCGLKVITQPKRTLSLVVALIPYLTLTGLFALFVIWNGEVVLGDKSNHVATLHLPQMLYIWPYFTFFSWPLLYPYIAALPFGLMSKLPSLASLEPMLFFRRRRLLPRIWLILASVAVACIVVHFNTIVHPFTLADNRHYTFYVFRLLMRPAWVKYAVTPVYIWCGWACVQALSARPIPTTMPVANGPASQTPAGTPSSSVRPLKPLSLPDGTNSASTSFVLIWLATTTLQLVTSPLVEPRYLILPWIFWRIHLPLQRWGGPNAPSLKAKLATLDHRLWLETAWLLLVNAVTGYIFLKWEFVWPQEAGKVQRFMW